LVNAFAATIICFPVSARAIEVARVVASVPFFTNTAHPCRRRSDEPLGELDQRGVRGLSRSPLARLLGPAVDRRLAIAHIGSRPQISMNSLPSTS
jgi:hypothetical protein